MRTRNVPSCKPISATTDLGLHSEGKTGGANDAHRLAGQSLDGLLARDAAPVPPATRALASEAKDKRDEQVCVL